MGTLSLAGAGVARADNFPDLNGFTAVAPDAYFVTNENSSVRSIHFTTPDGIGCMFRASQNISPNSRQRLSCDGAVPGIPGDAQNVPNVPGVGGASANVPGLGGVNLPGIGTCPMGTVAQKGDGAFEISKGAWTCGTRPEAPVLNVGQKLTYGNVTCAVGGGGLTACQVSMGDQKHGFVLQPSGSTSF
ncbi:hypothetical protein MLB1_17585 [Mycobacteroides sp. LB1]|nr:hypothetical protein [Mycobacteroides sp. LB1]